MCQKTTSILRMLNLSQNVEEASLQINVLNQSQLSHLQTFFLALFKITIWLTLHSLVLQIFHFRLLQLHITLHILNYGYFFSQ